MSQVVQVSPGFVSPPIPVNQYSVVQVSPNATPGSVSVLYSQDSEVYIRAGTATWTAWPNGSVTSSSSMMSNARMFVMMSAQSSAATISVSDPTSGVTELVQSPWAGAEAGAMVFSSTVTFAGQILATSGTVSLPGIAFSNSVSTGISNSNQNLQLSSLGINGLNIDTNSKSDRLPSDWLLGWSSVTANNAAIDTVLLRDAASVIAMRNGPVSSQTLRVYGKFGATTTFASFSHNGTNTVVSTQGGGLSLSASTMGFYGVNVTTQPGSAGTSFASLSLSSGALASTLAIALNALGLIQCTSVAA